jgi:hypothetical protein
MAEISGAGMMRAGLLCRSAMPIEEITLLMVVGTGVIEERRGMISRMGRSDSRVR